MCRFYNYLKMKNILLLVSVALTILSCTTENSLTDKSSGESNPDPSVVLPKTISAGEEGKSTIIYDGKKIVKVVNEAGNTVYTYDGDLIVKIFSTEEENGKTVNDLVMYTYENGKVKTELTTITSIDQASNKVSVIRNTKLYYTYNSDGTVGIKDYRVESDGSEILGYTRVLTYLNGNVVKEVGQSAMTDGHFTKDYEYDGKNNVFTNVVGFDKTRLSFNNVLKITHTFRNEVQEEGQNITEYEYTYNESGYPLTLIKKLNGDVVDQKSFTY